jgi:hypothetical protein
MFFPVGASLFNYWLSEQMTKMNMEFANWLWFHPEVNKATSLLFLNAAWIVHQSLLVSSGGHGKKEPVEAYP